MTAHPDGIAAFAARLVSSRWPPAVATVAAVALLSYSLAQWSWKLVTPKPAASVPASAPAAAMPDRAAALRTILSANLFGAAAPGSGVFSLDNLPVTSLNLVLTGVMVQGKGGYALIRIDGSDELPVAIGDEITAGAQLHAIYPDRAVLSRGGSYESLMLKEHGASLAPGSIVSSPARAATSNNTVVQAHGNQFTIDRESMQQQMQRPDFLSQALIVPNAGGGFLVREVQPGSIYERLGVRAGDVVRSINGQSVNTIDDVMKLYQGLSGLERAGNVSLEISRSGRNEQLHYNFN